MPSGRSSLRVEREVARSSLRAGQVARSFLGNAQVRRSRLDVVSTPDFTVLPTGDVDMIAGGSGFSIGNATVYMSASYMDVTEGNAQQPMFQCTLTDFLVHASAQPSPGTYTYTVRKNGINTGLTVALSGTGQTALFSGSVVVANLDLIDVMLVAAGGAPRAFHTFTLKVT